MSTGNQSVTSPPLSGSNRVMSPINLKDREKDLRNLLLQKHDVQGESPASESGVNDVENDFDDYFNKCEMEEYM